MLLVLGATSLFLAPLISSAISKIKPPPKRETQTQAELFKAAQVIAASGTYDVSSDNHLPPPGEGNEIPIGYASPSTDRWGSPSPTAKAKRKRTAIAIAVISPGADKTVNTTCADALTGARGDDDAIATLTHADTRIWASKTGARRSHAICAPFTV